MDTIKIDSEIFNVFTDIVDVSDKNFNKNLIIHFFIFSDSNTLKKICELTSQWLYLKVSDNYIYVESPIFTSLDGRVSVTFSRMYLVSENEFNSNKQLFPQTKNEILKRDVVDDTKSQDNYGVIDFFDETFL